MQSVSTTHYPKLQEVRKTLKPNWYRCAIDADRLRALSRRDDTQGWLQAGGHFLLFLLLSMVTLVFWSQEFWWLFFPALWCTGFVASYFSGTAPHELGHGTVFKTRGLNRAFLYLFSLISWWDPFDYAASHTYHHRYTTHPEADRENLLPIQPSLHPWLMIQLFTINLFSRPGRNFGKGGFFWSVYLTARTAIGLPAGHQEIASQQWLSELHSDLPAAYRQSVMWSRTLIGFHTGVLVLALATGWWVLPLLLSLSSFIAKCGSYFTGLPQHCGLRENVMDFRKNTRSIKLNPFMEFLYWRMNWHTEHHMYANVPCYNLKALSREIAHDMPEPHSLIGAWVEMRQIWRRQQQDPAYIFDTPVPENTALAAVAIDVDHELSSSMGDLAPEGLKRHET